MLSPLHILLIEDQHNIAQNIADYFEQKDHILDFAENGQQGFNMALAHYYDLIVLDLNLPLIDGINVCKQLRKQAQRHIPIIMLTARDSIEDKVEGFGAGADDYLTKPFALQELELRCIALSKRHLLNSNDTIILGPLTLNRKRQSVERSGKTVEVSTMGFKILTILADAYPQIVSRAELSHKLWGDEPTESDAMRSHIYQLRAALDKPFDTPLLKTVFGVGFVLNINHTE